MTETPITTAPPPSRRAFTTALTGLVVGLAAIAAPRRAGAEAPRPLVVGDPDRKAALDVLRATLEVQLGGPVEFRVLVARALRGWAIVRVEPQRPGGGRIDPRETIFAGHMSMMDGLTTDALLQKRDGLWFLITHAVGPTDAVSTNWQLNKVPEGLIYGDTEDQGETPR